MPEYLLPCACGQQVRVVAAQAGGRATCICGKSLAVPTLRGLRELEAAASEPSRKQAAGWSRLHGAVFAGALLIATVGASIAAFHGWQYLKIQLSPYSKDHSADVVRLEAEHIDHLSPEQTLTHWDKVLEEGLGPKDPFLWTQIQAAARVNLLWMEIGGGLIGGALLVAVTTLFVGRRAPP